MPWKPKYFWGKNSGEGFPKEGNAELEEILFSKNVDFSFCSNRATGSQIRVIKEEVETIIGEMAIFVHIYMVKIIAS